MPRNPVQRWIDTAHKGNVREAARALGINHVTLWRVARGHHARPPYSVARALAKHTNTEMESWLATSSRRGGGRSAAGSSRRGSAGGADD